jgi:hypothetical protein
MKLEVIVWVKNPIADTDEDAHLMGSPSNVDFLWRRSSRTP